MNDQYQTQRLSLLDRILILSGIAAPVLLLFSVLVAGSLHVGYSHISQAISELGAHGAPFSTILNYAGLVPAGILTLVFALAMFRRIKDGLALYISCGLVALAGLGRFFAGIFPCDPGCFPIITITGRLHAVFGLIALFAGSVAPLVMAFGIKRRHSQAFFNLSLVLGFASLMLFIVLVSRMWMPYFGGVQRLLLILTYTWIIAVAVIIRKVDNKAGLFEI
jgi:hypothetical membrane protein